MLPTHTVRRKQQHHWKQVPEMRTRSKSWSECYDCNREVLLLTSLKELSMSKLTSIKSFAACLYLLTWLLSRCAMAEQHFSFDAVTALFGMSAADSARTI
jgi:hypothetical protein